MAKKKVFSIGNALAQGLEETIELAQKNSGELRVEAIPLRKIELDPENPRNLIITMQDIEVGVGTHDRDKQRKLQEIDALHSLANSIKSHGILNPITVYKHADCYRVIAGERRTLASLIAGKTDIPAKIIDGTPNELKVSLLQWIENIERADLTLWERLTNLEKILAAHAALKGTTAENISNTELSELLGCSKPHAINYKAVLHADDLKSYIELGKIKNLEKAALIANIEDTVIRGQVLIACLHGATLRQLKNLVEQGKRERRNMGRNKQQPETRGRTTQTIHFGGTRHPEVAKAIISAIMNEHSKVIYAPHYRQHYQQLNWHNPRSVSGFFQEIISILEQQIVKEIA